MVAVEDLGYGIEVAGEVAFCSLGHAATTPGNEDMLRQTSVGILDLDKAELDAAFTEVFEEFAKFALCQKLLSACARIGTGFVGPSGVALPPVLSTLSTLSLLPEDSKTLTRGVWTAKRAHLANVGEPELGTAASTTELYSFLMDGPFMERLREAIVCWRIGQQLRRAIRDCRVRALQIALFLIRGCGRC